MPVFPDDFMMTRSLVFMVRSPVAVSSVDAPSKRMVVSAMEMSPLTSRVVPELNVRVPDVYESDVSDLKNERESMLSSVFAFSPAHVPFASLKHPAVSWSPFANVDDALPDVMLRRFALRPPENVDVEFVPRTARNPPNVDVAMGDATWSAPVIVVVPVPPMPRSPAMVVDPVVFAILRRVVVAEYVSLRVARMKSPSGVVDAIQCLRFAPAFGFEMTNCGVDVEEICNAPNGVDVPMPRRPCSAVAVSTVMKFAPSMVVAPE